MGCFDGNCSGEICKAEIRSPQFPPALVGWKLIGWPDFVPVKFRELLGGDSKTWEGNTHKDVIAEIVRILNVNSIPVDKTALCAWANEQWCAADPTRCKSSRTPNARLEVQRRAGLVDEKMAWATPFWKIANVAVSGDRPDAEARGAIEYLVTIASLMLNGEFGCVKCKEHFALLQSQFPPDRIMTWREARVWLWHVHNASRDSGKVVSYSDIAKIYGWESLTDAEISQILSSLSA